jgi:hypothetical protein
MKNTTSWPVTTGKNGAACDCDFCGCVIKRGAPVHIVDPDGWVKICCSAGCGIAEAEQMEMMNGPYDEIEK